MQSLAICKKNQLFIDGFRNVQFPYKQTILLLHYYFQYYSELDECIHNTYVT